jgi:hypothetical protein
MEMTKLKLSQIDVAVLSKFAAKADCFKDSVARANELRDQMSELYDSQPIIRQAMATTPGFRPTNLAPLGS